MAGLRFAAAQSASVPCDIAANVARHCSFIDAAHAAGVQLLVFPELSLSGYELAGMAACALAPDDARLAPLRERAAATGMTIVAGAPLANPAGLPSIGAITFHPDGRRSAYRKHFVDPSEVEFAAPGAAISQLHTVGGVPAALAICADTGNPLHPHAAAVAGARLYLAGSLISRKGHAAEQTRLATYAKLHGMGVLLVNHALDSGGYVTAGASAYWAPGGALVIAAPGPGQLLVVVDDDGATIIAVADGPH